MLHQRRGAICQVLPPSMANKNRIFLRSSEDEEVKAHVVTTTTTTTVDFWQVYRILVLIVGAVLLTLVTSILLGQVAQNGAYLLVFSLFYACSMVASTYPMLQIYRESFFVPPPTTDDEDTAAAVDDDECCIIDRDLMVVTPPHSWRDGGYGSYLLSLLERCVSSQVRVYGMLVLLVSLFTLVEALMWWRRADDGHLWRQQSEEYRVLRMFFDSGHLLLLPSLLELRILRVDLRRQKRMRKAWFARKRHNLRRRASVTHSHDDDDEEDSLSSSGGGGDSSESSSKLKQDPRPLQFLSLGLARSDLGSALYRSRAHSSPPQPSPSLEWRHTTIKAPPALPKQPTTPPDSGGGFIKQHSTTLSSSSDRDEGGDLSNTPELSCSSSTPSTLVLFTPPLSPSTSPYNPFSNISNNSNSNPLSSICNNSNPLSNISDNSNNSNPLSNVSNPPCNISNNSNPLSNICNNPNQQPDAATLATISQALASIRASEQLRSGLWAVASSQEQQQELGEAFVIFDSSVVESAPHNKERPPPRLSVVRASSWPILITSVGFCCAYLVQLGWQGRLGSLSLSVGFALLVLSLLWTLNLERTSRVAILFDFNYAWFYCTIITHLRLVVGPLLVLLVRATAKATWWNDLVLPLVVFLSLLLYLLLTQWISCRMSASLIFPRFLFVAQVFRYFFMNLVFGMTGFGVRYFLLICVSNAATVLEHGSLGVYWTDLLQQKLARLWGTAGTTPTTMAASQQPGGGAVVQNKIGTPRAVLGPPYDDDQELAASQPCASAELGGGLLVVNNRGVGDWRFPDQSSAYHPTYDYHHRLMLALVYEIRIGGQDLLADSLALVLTPTLVWFILHYGDSLPHLRLSLNAQHLWLRYGLAIAFRWLTWLWVHRLMTRRIMATQNRLDLWSVFGLYANEVHALVSDVNPLTIRLGLDATLQRYLPRALALYLQRRRILITDAELYTRRFLYDLEAEELGASSSSSSSLSVARYNVSNLWSCALYFFCLTILVVFSILDAFGDRNDNYRVFLADAASEAQPP